MEYICGFTFAPFCGAGVLNSASAKESLKQMQERTGADFVIFAPNGVQKMPIQKRSAIHQRRQ